MNNKLNFMSICELDEEAKNSILGDQLETVSSSSLVNYITWTYIHTYINTYILYYRQTDRQSTVVGKCT